MSEKKILIVDDKEDVREVIKMIISTFGGKWHIIECANGEEAVDRYKKYNPDIVFMDMVMPVKDGFEAINEMVECDEDAKSKIYIISAFSKKGQIKSILKEGKVSGVISKPPEIDDLINVLKDNS
jgi:two-component system, chemotaxis family, chemotaxis protein CheY